MNEAQPKTNSPPFCWWHSLMYSTGILLLVCGLPGTALLPFVLVREKSLDRSDALMFGLSMFVAEALIAGILLFFAGQITKRQLKKRAKSNETTVA